MKISTKKPSLKVSKATAQIYDQGITYNQTGLTYNEIGYAYGGLYGFQDVIKSNNTVKDIKPH